MSTEAMELTASTQDLNNNLNRLNNRTRLARLDILDGLCKWRIWLMLAYQDIKLRYRRSIIGPFWITISMAITVYSMGYLYSHLFHTDLKTYFPFLVSGMISWTLLSSLITDLSDTFSSSEKLIKQIKLPFSLYIHQVALRNIIIFFHNIVVIIPILIIFPESAHINSKTLILIPNLLLIYINAFSYGLVLALIGARYRDMSQIIKSLVQVAFFLTPVMWNPNVLPPADRYIVTINPFYAFVELIRAPMIGTTPTLQNYGMALVITFIGFYLCGRMFNKYRGRIVYWL